MLMMVPSQDGELFAAEIRRMLEAAGSVAPARAVIDAGTEYAPDSWNALATLDVAGLLIAADDGGAEAGIEAAVAVAMELGRVLVPGPFWSSAVVSATVLTTAVTPEARALLPTIAAGETVATTALIDGAPQWTPEAVAVEAQRDGGAWTLAGSSPFVTDAQSSDVVLVPARTPDGTAVFAVTRADAGDALTTTRLDSLDETRPLSRLEYRAVPARLIAAGDVADAALRRGFALGALMLVAAGVGAADRELQLTLEYARSRVQFGHVIGSYQSIKHRCADMFTRIESVRSALYHAAAVLGEPDTGGDEIAVAVHSLLAVGPERLLRCAGDTIQVHGGIGFTWEHDAHLYFKRAQADAKLLGDAVAHRAALARRLGLIDTGAAAWS